METKRTREDLRRASNHVAYEVWMFETLVQALASGVFGEGAIHNAIVEAVVVHLRNIIDFLWGKKKYDTDVVAGDFFESPESWGRLLPEMPDELKQAKRRADKEMAHLTYDRLEVKDDEKAWHFLEIANQLGPIWGTFKKNVPKENIGVGGKDPSRDAKPTA